MIDIDDNYVWNNRHKLDEIISKNITKKSVMYTICSLIETECFDQYSYFDDSEKELLNSIIKFKFINNPELQKNNLSPELVYIGYDLSLINNNEHKIKWFYIQNYMSEIYLVTYYNNGYIFEIFSNDNRKYVNIQNNNGKLRQIENKLACIIL